MVSSKEQDGQAGNRVNEDTLMRNRFRGCLVGGAVGDALGAPVEFMRHQEIVREFGRGGIRDYVPAYGRLGAITDDTQMTLFTAEGMLRAYVRGRMRGLSTFEGVTDHAYQRWLLTQNRKSRVRDVSRDGWLWPHKDLHHRRAPGLTCLAALEAKDKFGQMATNDSKGCGGVMRVAPVGMFAWHERDRENALQAYFDVGCDLAGLTHGHPTGMLTAGVFAVLVLRLLDGSSMEHAVRDAQKILETQQSRFEGRPGVNETGLAVAQAVALAGEFAAKSTDPSVEASPQHIAQLGEGWVAEEALAITIFCALVAKDFEHGVTLAVNHSGDSDSTGAMTGNLLGAMLGVGAIPERWINTLELKDVTESLADDLYDYPSWNIGEYLLGDDNDNRRINERYPGV
jgi:ADP-ribosylglycohydrolase